MVKCRKRLGEGGKFVEFEYRTIEERVGYGQYCST